MPKPPTMPPIGEPNQQVGLADTAFSLVGHDQPRPDGHGGTNLFYAHGVLDVMGGPHGDVSGRVHLV